MRRLILGLTTVAVAAAPATGSVPRVQSTAASTQRPAVAPARVRCANCGDSTRRVLIVKLDSLRAEFERNPITNEANAALVREIGATIMALQGVFGEGPRRIEVRRLDEDMARLMEAEARRATEAPATFTFQFQPGQKRGYLGVIFDGPSTDIITDRDRIIRFYDYPRIASVDPSSPAERAGILVGDTVLAFNGVDVVDRAFSLAKLLVPDEKFTMKVRRLGDAKEFRIVVGEAPSYAIARAAPLPATSVTVLPATPAAAPVPPGRVQTSVSAPVARAGPRQPGFESAEAPPFAVPRVNFFGNGIAGARLEVLNASNETLGTLLGTREGLLVISVSPGSPAAGWNVRDGDVILSADGEPMRTFSAFRRVVAEQDRSRNPVKLVVLRDKKRIDIVIK